MSSPVVIPRDQHQISRANISPNALKVLYRLKAAGYEAHLVGGGVRDLLLGREPKDFDVATDASPEQVRQTFRNCRLIGRRFRLAHVQFGSEIIEVATFRAGQDAEVSDNHQTDEGMLLRDNVYGTIEQDALRRDFTVNALYYNISDFSIIDYAGGVEDLGEGLLRLLGDPETRYREDPVRMLRAVRFAAKLGFRLAPGTESPIPVLASLLADVPSARLFEEVLKLFLGGTAVACFEKLRQYGLFAELFPDTDASLARLEHEFPLTLVLNGLENTDNRIREDKPVTPAFLFAVLLWEPVRLRAEKLQADGESPYQAVQRAGGEVVARQVQRIALPRRFSTPMQEIWGLQSRFLQTRGKRPQRLLTHPRFRAAYDFLLLRAQSGEADPELASWWTDFQDGNAEAPAPTEPGSAGRRSRRGGRRRRRKPAVAEGE
ncbi:MAG TPA: polynucleotide adenylyltransferase PcnB [Gammaproteobacteria bacterium]|nr:polynucleotide adenylyltransferase PcnB [Gammaproteobacteria bacterium]MCP5439127.1 polynucleotide adenylyltransferase PcnB [Chromatiaceae bacterium]MCW5585303.1 polynucleotide adenylyltransferase PcnB [Chromatiales bacterium]HOP16610.1 polynucleotide adenylyltransferase PcnB [Gammaproteobacteria bacterium]HPQ25543.1 polynucleotide adenylyltransferase PcnB [Gammaproteobacteria bacterium]